MSLQLTLGQNSSGKQQMLAVTGSMLGPDRVTGTCIRCSSSMHVGLSHPDWRDPAHTAPAGDKHRRTVKRMPGLYEGAQDTGSL